MNAKHTSAPVRTISAFRRGPALRPNWRQSAGYRSTAPPQSCQHSSHSLSAPVGHAPDTRTALGSHTAISAAWMACRSVHVRDPVINTRLPTIRQSGIR